MRIRNRDVENRWSTDQLAAGISTRGWLKVLRDASFSVDRTYLHRAAWITGLSIPMSVLGRFESLRFGATLSSMEVEPAPIFVLGHWRSGTTHLHNLLGRDPSHTYSTVYQAVFPGHFLTTGRLGPRLLENALPSTRSYDAVKHGWFEAAEDEIALMKLTHGLSFYTAVMFPDQAESYERYIDFRDTTDEERTRFGDALEYLVKKIMLATGGKRVVVKSCLHSARIPLILERFPNARFVHIHRHPARVFRSMLHMRSRVDWENYMHRPTRDFVDARVEHTARIGERLFERLIEDRALIPEGNLVELAYDELVGAELEHMEATYSSLGLPGFEAYRPILSAYLASIEGYQRNKLEIEDALLDFVYARWRRVYDTYGYLRAYTQPD